MYKLGRVSDPALSQSLLYTLPKLATHKVCNTHTHTHTHINTPTNTHLCICDNISTSFTLPLPYHLQPEHSCHPIPLSLHLHSVTMVTINWFKRSNWKGSHGWLTCCGGRGFLGVALLTDGVLECFHWLIVRSPVSNPADSHPVQTLSKAWFPYESVQMFLVVVLCVHTTWHSSTTMQLHS